MSDGQDWTMEDELAGRPAPPTDEDQAEVAAAARRERILRPARVTRYVNAWTRLRRAVATFAREAPAVGAEAVEQQDWAGLAQTIQAIQQYRADLGRTEAYLTRELGRAMGQGLLVLPSGAQAEVRKAKDRKAWDHAAWRRDVRQKVAAAALAEHPDDPVNPATGETVNVAALLFSVMEQVQDAHGAGAPKVTALKALGLNADDYAEVNPGPWSIQITASQPATEK